ncbi:MAG: hypothetical protein NZ992_02785 [Candidatus Korarchaeum sp.]|nr:hypothetical protein [Candidatus Korarchaeum sp.]MDW8035473.1 hypothetical protein [Candidatus Korarchaeum sp.]
MSLEEAITVSKKGKRELRTLVSRGRFVLIEYRDPITKERTEDKYKLVLIHEDGSFQEFFVIPTKTEGRSMLVEPKEKKGKELKVWNPATGEVEDMFPQ